MSNRISIFNVSVQISVRVIGSNPEMAELGNPRGEILGDFGNIVATDGEGRLFVLAGVERNLWDLECEERQWLDSLAAKVRAAGSIDPALWDFDRWSYGSRGWNAQELALEQREEV